MRVNETNQTKIRGVEHPHIFDKISRYFVFTQEPVILAKRNVFHVFMKYAWWG